MEKLKKIWQNKVFYILIVLTLAFVTPITGKPAESELRAIIASMGVDLAPNGIEITVGVLSAKGEADIISNLDPVSANGENIDIAIYNLGVKLGKQLGLSHCQYVVFSAEMFEEDATKYLDYFIRNNNLTENAVFIATEGKARDVIEAATNKDSPYNTAIKNMIIYNEEFLFTINMNIESFFNAYYGYEGISVLGLFNAIDEEKESKTEDGPGGKGQEDALEKEGLLEEGFEEGEEKEDSSSTGQGDASGDANQESGNAQSASSGGTGGTGGGTSATETGEGEDKPKIIQYQANMMIVKDGKKVRKLTKEEVSYLKIYHHFIRTVFIKVDDINTPEFKDASITFEVFNKRAKSEVYYINDVPVYKIRLKLSVKFDEINAVNKTIDSLDEVRDLMLPTIYEQLVKKVEEYYVELIKNTKEHKTDVLGIYSMFNKKYNKRWKEYINSLEDKETYLEGIVYEIEIDADTKL